MFIPSYNTLYMFPKTKKWNALALEFWINSLCSSSPGLTYGYQVLIFPVLLLLFSHQVVFHSL